jgi:predicted ATP-dependent endonuclease of OLD family
MKLKRVQVQNFRSIVNSGNVDIEDRVTVLIGKNEQGKSNFLKAIASFTPKRIYAPNDLPNHLRPQLEEQKPGDIPIVSLWLAPDPSDVEVLREAIPTMKDVKEFKAVRYYDGHYAYHCVISGGTEKPVEFSPPKITSLVEELKGHAESLKEKLKTHASRVATFAPSLPQANTHVDQFVGANFQDSTQIDNLIKTFTTALRGLPGQDQAIQEDISLSIKEVQAKHTEIQSSLQQDSKKIFEGCIPRFIFHSTILDRIPNDVNVADFINNSEGSSPGMAKLCSAAGLSLQKIKELASATDTPLREVYEDHYRSTISGGLNEYWTQETYTVHFRIEKEKLSVSISDGTYSARIAPLDRSDGFQWYLSFYSAILSEVTATEPMVLLLDNPALDLHADGQRDIKRFLEEKVPFTTQVAYVTHSPAMIDAYNLEQVRQVEMQGNLQGTKVGKLRFKDGREFDLLEPVRSAIGASLVSSLVLNEYNVLVEGAADKPILEGAFTKTHAEVKDKILVNGSVSETKDGFLPRFYQRANLPFVIYLDADSRGRELAEELKRWGIPEEKIVRLQVLESETGKDCELEDLMNREFYHAAVKEAYPDHDVEPCSSDSGKVTRHYEEKFREKYGIGFNKRRVGEMVKKLLINNRGDEQTVNKLRELTDKIWLELQRQVGKA